MRERNINEWLPLEHPLLGTWPITQACALPGNRTSDPLVPMQALNPLNHTSQGNHPHFYIWTHIFLFFIFLLNLLGWWHWLIKLYRFQVYNSMIHHLYILLCVHHSKSFPSTTVYPPLPISNSLPPSPLVITMVLEKLHLLWTSVQNICHIQQNYSLQRLLLPPWGHNFVPHEPLPNPTMLAHFSKSKDLCESN